MNQKKSHIEPSSPPYLRLARSKHPKILELWYRLSCPEEPEPDTPYLVREKYRRGQMASIILLLLQIFVITSLPAGFSGTNPLLAVLMVFAFIANCVAMVVNRRGMVTLAGLIIILNVEASMSTNIITTPGGLSLSALPLFDLLVIPLVLTASLLPIAYVFLVAILNSLFAIFGTLYLPHSPELAAVLQHSVFGLVTLPVSIQMMLAVIAFLWVRGANQALARADRAEQIARLEHDIAESQELALDQKRQLEESIQLISRTLTRVANGDTSARITTEGNVLWLLVGPINNMLTRIQRSRQMEAEHQQMVKELEWLLMSLRSSRETRQPLRLPASQKGMLLNPLYEELSRILQQENKASPITPVRNPFN